MDSKLDAILTNLTTEEKSRLLKALQMVVGKPRQKYTHNTVIMHNHILCHLCKRERVESYPFDLLTKDKPKDSCEKHTHTLFCHFCQEELMKLEKYEAIEKLLNYIRGLSLISES